MIATARATDAGAMSAQLFAGEGERRLPAALAPPLRPAAALAVLDVTEFFGETSGGVRTYLMEKAAYVEARPELRQVLVVPARRDAVRETAGVRCYRLRGPRVPTQRPYRFMLATRSNRRIVEHERPDVIEVGSPGLVPWIVARPARALGIPLVHFFHSNYLALAGDGRLGQAARRYARALDRRFAATIVASATLADELVRLGLDGVTRIPLGVDLDCFHPGARDEELRRGLAIGAAPLVLYAGRLAREKRLDLLLTAWADIHRRSGAHLLLVGDGPLRARLRAQAASVAADGTVHWLPHVADRQRLASLLASADLFVSPGGVETFGLAALEALASGTPVVASDRGGVAELVAHAGAGALFRDGDPAALATAVVGVLAADRDALGRRARAHAEQEHDWQRTFGRLVALYASVRR